MVALIPFLKIRKVNTELYKTEPITRQTRSKQHALKIIYSNFAGPHISLYKFLTFSTTLPSSSCAFYSWDLKMLERWDMN